jgi:hypothetical protein
MSTRLTGVNAMAFSADIGQNPGKILMRCRIRVQAKSGAFANFFIQQNNKAAALGAAALGHADQRQCSSA